MNANKNSTVLEGCLIAIISTLIIVLVLALPTMWLWNWLMPDLFGLRTITFIEALGINLLSSILFHDGTTVKND